MLGVPARVARYIGQVERLNLIYRSREQELGELYEGPVDAQGIANRIGPLVMRDKNYPYVRKVTAALPFVPEWRHRLTPHWCGARGCVLGADGYCLHYPPLGFDGAVRFIRTDVAMAIDSVWLRAPGNGLEYRDYHRVKMFLYPRRSHQLLRPDYVGDEERADLDAAVETFAAGRSLQFAWFESKETQIEPVDAQRKPYAR